VSCGTKDGARDHFQQPYPAAACYMVAWVFLSADDKLHCWPCRWSPWHYTSIV